MGYSVFIERDRCARAHVRMRISTRRRCAHMHEHYELTLRPGQSNRVGVLMQPLGSLLHATPHHSKPVPGQITQQIVPHPFSPSLHTHTASGDLRNWLSGVRGPGMRPLPTPGISVGSMGAGVGIRSDTGRLDTQSPFTPPTVMR